MKSGFGLVEAIVALVVFAVGALGAAALTAHAARLTSRAERWETVLLRMEALVDSLGEAGDAAHGAREESAARFEWSREPDGIGDRIEVRALPGGTDTLVLRAYRADAPPLLLPW